MTTDTPGDQPLSSPDEEYWQSLLEEGEYAKSTLPTVEESHSNPTYIVNNVNNQNHQQAHLPSIWDKAQQLYNSETDLFLDVVGYNRGGVLVDWENMQGFVPSSQLSNPPTENHDLDRYVGKNLKLRIIEIYPDKNRLILSERAAEVASGKRNEILHSLKPGDVVEGIITNLTHFGAFVDLGGVEGLIHISELSWGRVGHPADMLQKRQSVKAYVISIDRDNIRIALSLKRLYEDPWLTVEDRYHVHQVVEGKITNVVDFGAFACIEEGLEGLIHFSELAEGQFLHPRNVVSEGDVIQAKILRIDCKARRIGLSLRLV